ncbi:DUF4160 domain-containing protein [Spirulina sp. CCNP1310]|nr:DUF4160 domain-containing protein [Spirulina sp. CCNP1310]
MPEITRFYGIVIKMFFGDHSPPHFHAVYGEYNALVGIESLGIIEGDFPNRAEKWSWSGQLCTRRICSIFGIVKSLLNFHP